MAMACPSNLSGHEFPPWKITQLSSRAQRKPNRSLTSDIDYTSVFPCPALIRKRFSSWLRNEKKKPEIKVLHSLIWKKKRKMR